MNVPFTANPPGGPMVEYEMSTADALLSRGYAVVMPDYEGLGTPGVHTYVNRLAEAHAVLDAARARQLWDAVRGDAVRGYVQQNPTDVLGGWAP